MSELGKRRPNVITGVITLELCFSKLLARRRFVLHLGPNYEKKAESDEVWAQVRDEVGLAWFRTFGWYWFPIPLFHLIP